MVVDGRRLPIKRPRVHAVDGDGSPAGDVGLESLGVFAGTDVLNATVMERMPAGVATRSFARVGDPIGAEQRSRARSTSKSAVSRRLVTGTKKALDQLLHRDLSQVDAAVLMIDGVDFAGSMCDVAPIVAADGTKIPVGLRQGDTDPHAGMLKARRLADEPDKTCPDAAGSLREGLDDMFTVRRLGIDGTPARTLICTNMIESMFDIMRTTTRSNFNNQPDILRVNRVARWAANRSRLGVSNSSPP